MANGVGLGEIEREIALQHARWKVGDNPIWRLSPEEQKRRLGATAPLGTQIAPAPFPRSTARVPAAFDYRSVGGKSYITSIRDQGGCGSCVAFGCIAAIEGTLSWQQKHNNPTLDLSEAQLFFCYGSTDGANCAKGYWPAQALPHCVNPGLVDEACFPYADHDQSCSLCADWKTG
jgi:C1A family cysteine protease